MNFPLYLKDAKYEKTIYKFESPSRYIHLSIIGKSYLEIRIRDNSNEPCVEWDQYRSGITSLVTCDKSEFDEALNIIKQELI